MASAVEARSGMEIEQGKRSAFEIEAEQRGASFKYGLVTPFLQKFPFEDEESLPSSYYYGSSDDSDENDDEIAKWRKYKNPNAHETVKKFLEQVRKSNGYDVDCCPPSRIGSPFCPINPELEDERFRKDLALAVDFAIDQINAETGKNYKLVKVERTVTCNFLFFLTLTVKEGDVDVDASLLTLRAMVDLPYYRTPEQVKLALVEWMYMPPPPSPSPSLCGSIS